MKKSVTLVELTLAIALMGVIVIGIASFDVGSRRFLQASERKTQVLNEATLIMDRITKDAFSGIGTVTDPAIVTDAANPTFLRIIPDTNGNGIRDAGDDRWIRYRYINTASNPDSLERVRRDAAGNDTVEFLSTRVRNFNVIRPAGTNTAQLVLILRFDPNTAINAFSNPQVSVQTNVEAPGWSLN